MYDRKRPRKWDAVIGSRYLVSREGDYVETIWACTEADAYEKARQILPEGKSLMRVTRASTGRRR